MNTMRLLGIGVIVCLIGAAARAEDKVDYAKLIVGKWEAVKTDEGTLPKGAVVEFTKDGKLLITAKEGDMEIKVDGTYKLEGKKFKITVKIGEQEKTHEITITKISDKEMATKDEDGKVVELARKK